MKSKKQKRAEALSRLERYHANNPQAGDPAFRVKHIAYLHGILDRPDGRVRTRKEAGPAPAAKSPGNPVGMPPRIFLEDLYA